MGTLPVRDVIDPIVVLLTEAYDGPPDPSETWFIDNEPDCGVLGILKGVSAAEASKSVDGTGNRGTTIASNAEHLRWSLANANAAIRGEPYDGKWEESWNLLDADEAAWKALRQSLRGEFNTLRESVKNLEDLPPLYLLGVMALIPHAAYHLGTLRQMVERVRSG